MVPSLSLQRGVWQRHPIRRLRLLRAGHPTKKKKKKKKKNLLLRGKHADCFSNFYSKRLWWMWVLPTIIGPHFMYQPLEMLADASTKKHQTYKHKRRLLPSAFCINTPRNHEDQVFYGPLAAEEERFVQQRTKRSIQLRISNGGNHASTEGFNERINLRPIRS